jgi:hypothetical protein
METTADRAVKRAKATLLREEEEKEDDAANVLLEKFGSFRGSVAHITALDDQLRLVKAECEKLKTIGKAAAETQSLLEGQVRLSKAECEKLKTIGKAAAETQSLLEGQLRLSKEECEKVKANCKGAVSKLRASVDLYLNAYDGRSFEALCLNFAEDLRMMVSIEERKGKVDFVRIENYRHHELVAEHKSIEERELFVLFSCRRSLVLTPRDVASPPVLVLQLLLHRFC